MDIKTMKSVLSIGETAASDMVRNFIAVISNPTLFSPTYISHLKLFYMKKEP